MDIKLNRTTWQVEDNPEALPVSSAGGISGWRFDGMAPCISNRCEKLAHSIIAFGFAKGQDWRLILCRRAHTWTSEFAHG